MNYQSVFEDWYKILIVIVRSIFKNLIVIPHIPRPLQIESATRVMQVIC